MDKKYIYELDYEIVKLVQNLEIDKKEIKIAGSSIIRDLRYFADYDFFSQIYKKPKIEKLERDLIKILNSFNNENMLFLELKIQTTDNKKYRVYPKQEFHTKMLKDAYKDLDFIKLDFAYYNINTHIWKEVSIMYMFKKIDNPTSKLDEFEELAKEKQYYKALKRYFSHYKNNATIRSFLLRFFNSNYGKLYTINENLKLLMRIKKYYKSTDIKRKLDQNLILLGYSKFSGLDKSINKNTHILNNGAYEFAKNNIFKDYIE